MGRFDNWEHGITVAAKKKIDELQARNDRQTEEITKLWGLTKRNDMLQAEKKRLKKALKKYGRCLCGCCNRAVLVESKGKGKGWYAKKCDCGFEQTLKEK